MMLDYRQDSLLLIRMLLLTIRQIIRIFLNQNPIIHSRHRTIIRKIVEKTKAEIRVETSRTRSHSSQIQIKDKLSQCSQCNQCSQFSRYSQLIHKGMIKEIRRIPNLFFISLYSLLSCSIFLYDFDTTASA